MKAAKVGLVVLLVSLLVTAGVAAQAVETVYTKEVIQTLDKIEIRTAKPIDFYPGVLIGSPKDYTVERVDIIYEKADGNVTVTLASMTIKSSGKLIDGYVLAAWSEDVSFGTIILPGKDGWRAAETDIAIFTNSAKTRTLIAQSFKPTLSQHYASLMDAVSMAGKGEAYAKLNSMLKYVSDVVKRDLKEFDRVVENSKATVTVYDSDVGILSEQIDNKYLSVTVQGDLPNPSLATISGTFSSWRDAGNLKHIEFLGSFGFSGSGQVMIDPWYTISFEEEQLVWGWAVLTQNGGVDHQYVEYVCWLGSGGWNVKVKTYQFSTTQTSVPVYLFAWTGGDGDGASAYLSLV